MKAKEPTGRYIVRLRKHPTLAPQLEAARMFAFSLTQAQDIRFLGATSFAAKMTVESALTVAARPEVQAVFEDGRKKIREAAASWGTERVFQRSLPLDGQYDRGPFDGTGVHFFGLDTGIDTTHPEFAGRVGVGFSVFGGQPTDGHGHGTHTAATAAGKTFGVAPGMTVHAVKGLNDQGSGSDEGIIVDLQWIQDTVTENHWRAVVNMSIGGGDSWPLNMKVCEVTAAGIPVAAAAGNESADADTSSPGRVAQALTVAASDKSDDWAWFSNFGPIIDVIAPGYDIISAKPGGGSATMSGTSMATPHVAGAVGIYLQAHPLATPAQVAAALISQSTPDKIHGVPSQTQNRLLFARE